MVKEIKEKTNLPSDKNKEFRPCNISSKDALTVLSTFFNNPSMELISYDINKEGGLTFIFEDTTRNYPVRFNKVGFFALIRFGLESIAQNG